ncbi:NAD 5'-nucleotidase [invertebrate metagenome]|uniref:NAD 5'-nucleotidase n=1 Tax=invertebrate metagenome TaxID=1711999 RepID=A0A2H9TB21_9ZZZZ
MIPLKKMALAVAVISSGVYLTGCSQPVSEQTDADNTPLNLTVIHINDTHSAFDPTNSSFHNDALSEVSDNGAVYTAFGGHPRLKTEADAAKQKAENNDQSLLFLHGGDAFQGSGYFVLNQGKMNSDILSDMGLDAMALGNHEFDAKLPALAKFIQSVNFPVLANNIDVKDEPTLKDADNLKPYALYAFDGNDKEPLDSLNHLPEDKAVVAVIGVALEDMKDISSDTGNIEFKNEIKSTQETIDALKAKGVNKIVVLSHIGNARDQRLAESVNGIDLIVGGHSHTLLGDFTDLGKGNPGAYAALFTNPDQKGQTCVVQAGVYAQAMGEVTVGFDAWGNVTQCEGTNTLLSSDHFYRDAIHKESMNDQDRSTVTAFIDKNPKITVVPEDTDMRKKINVSYKPALDNAYGQVIGQVPTEIKHERRPGDGDSDEHGSDVAPLVAEGQYFWANQPEILQKTHMPVDFSLIAAGGVRTNIEPGTYREGNVSMELLPFKNAMSVLQVKGSAVRKLISQTVKATLPASAHAGKFPYGGHLRYTFDVKADGLTQLDYKDKQGQWHSLDNDHVYTIALNSYNANGQDGWDALFKDQASHQRARFDIAKQLKRSGSYTYQLYPVTGLSKNDKEKIVVRYKDDKPLQCGVNNISCDTDAQAFIDYVSKQRQNLTPLKQEPVTIKRYL